MTAIHEELIKAVQQYCFWQDSYERSLDKKYSVRSRHWLKVIKRAAELRTEEIIAKRKVYDSLLPSEKRLTASEKRALVETIVSPYTADDVYKEEVKPVKKLRRPKGSVKYFHCIHCGRKVASEATLNRFHDDNCLHRPVT